MIEVARRRRNLARTLSRPHVWQTAYLAIIFVGGVLILVDSIRELNATNFGLRWTIFAALTMVGGFARLRRPNVPASRDSGIRFPIQSGPARVGARFGRRPTTGV